MAEEKEEKVVKKEHLETAMRRAKQESRAVWQTVTLSADGWTANTDDETLNEGYAYAYDLAIAGVTAMDSAESFTRPGDGAASDCGLCTGSNVMDGCIRYYAKAIPAADIILQVRIIQGLESDNA